MSSPYPALLASLLTAALACCKPASEPPRSAAPPDAATTPWLAERDVGLAAPSGTILVDGPVTDLAPGADVPPLVGELAAPGEIDAGPGAGDAPDDVVAGGDAAEVDPSVAAGDASLVPLAATSIVLPEELVAKVRAAPTARAEDDARRLNRTGLQKHRRLELEAAIRDYQQALDAWPGHPFSNYNIACAYALTGHPDDALRHLAILAVVGDEASRDRLLSARTDADFDAMLDDPRFREVTGYTPIYVSWSPGLDKRVDAQRIATALHGAHLSARATPTAWETRYDRPTLLVRPNDAVAARAAEEVRAAVTLGAIDQKDDPSLDLRRTVVLVLPAPPAAGAEAAVAPRDGDDRPGEVSAPAVGLEGDARAFSDLVGVRLAARDGGTVQKLLLKPTGFFEWEVATPDGGRTLRRGRYAVRGDALALDYREDVQTPGPDPTAPEVRFEEGKRSTHPFALTSAGLTMDGVTFRLQ
ncbi:MAG: hypothetical protein CVU56_06590 [Deltaproteobacteria bacterium HGW-Deltaproteobacteria-14]|jgi:hypothetical protein|nr:MAG: hypothetical protein CVU56_06590 [Deltaproteobacteria bacterium HGW-Deltaproteobacteria-14]